MKKQSEEHHEAKHGICQICGTRVILPCEACQAEALQLWQRREQPPHQELSVTADLSIQLDNPGWQRRYEEIRNFRDKYGCPMLPKEQRVQTKHP